MNFVLVNFGLHLLIENVADYTHAELLGSAQSYC